VYNGTQIHKVCWTLFVFSVISTVSVPLPHHEDSSHSSIAFSDSPVRLHVLSDLSFLHTSRTPLFRKATPLHSPSVLMIFLLLVTH
jgi:hypothetical protein